MDEIKLKRLEALHAAMSIDTPSTQEVAQLIAQIIEVVRQAKEHLEKMVSNSSSEMAEKHREMYVEMERMESKMEKMMKEHHQKMKVAHKEEMDTLTTELYVELKILKDSIPSPTDLSDLYGKIEEVRLKIVPPTPEETKLALEKLEGDERLDKSAIKGLDELERKIDSKSSGRIVGGARGIQLYTDSTKRGQAQTVNLIAGAGISLNYTYSSGRNDITITAGAGGAGETPSGTIDGSNTVFTFLVAPKVIIVDQGRTLILNNGFTADATGLIITVAVAPTFSIFSI